MVQFLNAEIWLKSTKIIIQKSVKIVVMRLSHFAKIDFTENPSGRTILEFPLYADELKWRRRRYQTPQKLI